MVAAKDGSIADRALVNPDRNNFGHRLGFAWTAIDKTVIRGGYGIGYVHYNRAGAGNLLPIHGPQVINAVVNQTPPNAPSSAGQGYGRARRSDAVQPADRQHHVHARQLPGRPRAELVCVRAA
jgi:hypothetical protein